MKKPVNKKSINDTKELTGTINPSDDEEILKNDKDTSINKIPQKVTVQELKHPENANSETIGIS